MRCRSPLAATRPTAFTVLRIPGYRNNSTQGIATGDNPEVIYEVSDGTYNPQGCCFDFGNAETTNGAGGPGEMEALLFGKAYWDTGSGSGPWVLADMEVGVYNHGGSPGTVASPTTPTNLRWCIRSLPP